MAKTVTDPVLRERMNALRARLDQGLAKIDPYHRLHGRPVSYQVIAGQTFEITYRDVPRIGEAEVLGVRRLVGESCYFTVMPQTAETLTVRFVVPLKEE